jgi:hypothetical protein
VLGACRWAVERFVVDGGPGGEVLNLAFPELLTLAVEAPCISKIHLPIAPDVVAVRFF